MGHGQQGGILQCLDLQHILVSIPRLENIPSHYFNISHKKCGDWCHAGKDDYKPGLPYGRWLTGSPSSHLLPLFFWHTDPLLFF